MLNNKDIKIGVALLVGGLGSRLGAATENHQKCAIEIRGHPFIELVIRSFVKIGIENIILLAGYKSTEIFNVAHGIRQESPNLNISVVVESCPLGTGGALKNIPLQTDIDYWIVANGDTYYEDINIIANLLDCEIDESIDLHLINGIPAFSEGTAGRIFLGDNRCDWSRVNLSKRNEGSFFSGMSIMKKKVLRITRNCSETFEDFTIRVHNANFSIEIVHTNLRFYDIGTIFRLGKFKENWREEKT